MALTRKMLKAMGIEDEKIDQIIEEHSESVEALKKQRDAYKVDADRVNELEKQLEDAKRDSSDDFQEKYEAEHQAFENFKAEVASKEAKAKVESAYCELLKKAGIDSKRINSVLKVTDLSKIETDDDGDIKDAEKIIESVKEEWSDFIATTDTKGATVDTPPAGTGGSKTKDEILAIKDVGERQAAIAENHELFGF